jgi:hypothetical protein
VNTVVTMPDHAWDHAVPCVIGDHPELVSQWVHWLWHGDWATMTGSWGHDPTKDVVWLEVEL